MYKSEILLPNKGKLSVPEIIDIYGIIEKFSVYATSANISRTKEILYHVY